MNAWRLKEEYICRGSVSAKVYGRGGTRVSVKITCEEEERTGFETDAYVAIMEGNVISEVKKRRGKKRRKGEKEGKIRIIEGVEEEKRKIREGVIEVELT